MKNIQKRITTIIFFITLLILPLITLFSKKEDFSSLENRQLQKRPEFSLDDWFDKSFMKDFENYVSDP